MDSIEQYILSTFNMGVDLDAKQYSKNAKLTLLPKREYKVFPLQIKYPHLKNMRDEYIEQIKKATSVWSEILNNEITFSITDVLYGADIKVYWTKTSIKYAGLQYTEWNLNHYQPCVAIAIMNFYGMPYSVEDVYKTILHEFGHVLGLGHSPDINDVMCPEWNRVNKPSINDELVLKLIYSLGTKSYAESEYYIEKYLKEYLRKQNNNNLNLVKDIQTQLLEMGNMNKHNLLLQNINLDISKYIIECGAYLS